MNRTCVVLFFRTAAEGCLRVHGTWAVRAAQPAFTVHGQLPLQEALQARLPGAYGRQKGWLSSVPASEPSQHDGDDRAGQVEEEVPGKDSVLGPYVRDD